MQLLSVLLIVSSIISISTAWRSFLRGRSKYGHLGEPVLSSTEYSLPKEQWFVQLLDHFNPRNIHVWNQRYFVNDAFHKPNGPVFLLIEAGGIANPEWMVEGEWIDYAKEFGAMCFYLEHRFYGKSHPTEDLSLENLTLLSSEIALGDFAYFIQSMNDKYKFPNDTKWIVFGGSYGGSLAAWMRLKYPHLVHGAVSASAPLLAQIDFQEYYVVVENALKQYSQKCVDTIVEANREFHLMLLNAMYGERQIEEKFRLCDPLDRKSHSKRDISNLYKILASNFADVVQYNKANRQNFKTANITIGTICDILTDEKIGTPFDRLAHMNSILLNATNEKCLDYKYDNMIHEFQNITLASEQAQGGRQWMYQTCSEFGFFQTSTAHPNVLSKFFPSVDFFVQQCFDIFGPKYTMDMIKSAIPRTNTLYGALNIQVTNVVFVHGSMDPWHMLGITQSSNPQAPAIFINGTAHCANMYPPLESDIPELKQARVQIKGIIEQWLNN